MEQERLAQDAAEEVELTTTQKNILTVVEKATISGMKARTLMYAQNATEKAILN